MKKMLIGFVSFVLFVLSAFFAIIVVYLVSSEVMPAIRQGSLRVETSVMILNRTWAGNEIYVLIAAYALLAGAFACAGIRYARKAMTR